MARWGSALLIAAVLAFVGWQVWRITRAEHTAFHQRPYEQAHLEKVLAAFESRAGSEVSIFDLRLAPDGAFVESLEPDGVKDYRIDEDGKVLRVTPLSTERNMANVFPVARVDAAAPDRIFDAIAADTGHREYLLRAKLAPTLDGKLRWTAEAGKLGFGTGEYEALPDGTITSRPARRNLSAYASCLKKAGTNAPAIAACKRRLPLADRRVLFGKCVGHSMSAARATRCKRIWGIP